MNCTLIPEKVQQEILEAVAEGTGLVIFNPRPLSEQLKGLIEKSKPVATEAVNAVVDGLPTGNLPPFKEQSPSDLIGQGVRFYRAGDGGRIVVLDYSPLALGNYETSNSYFSPPGAGKEIIRDIYYDYYCSLAGRSILWAADEMPEVKLTGWEGLSESIKGSGSLGDLMVGGLKLPQGAAVELTVRDSDSAIEQRSSLKVGSDGQIGVEVNLLKSGSHYAALWGNKKVIITSTSNIKTISYWCLVVIDNGVISKID
jgi:hypothetical protein